MNGNFHVNMQFQSMTKLGYSGNMSRFLLVLLKCIFPVYSWPNQRFYWYDSPPLWWCSYHLGTMLSSPRCLWGRQEPPQASALWFHRVYPKRQHAWIHCGVNPSNSVVGFRCLGRSFKQQGGCRYLFLVPTTQGRWLSHPLVSYLGEHIPDRFQSLLANYINSCCNCDNDIGASPPQTAKLVYNSNNYGI
jgi:hypothetical protein